MHRVSQLATQKKPIKTVKGKTNLSWVSTSKRPPYVMMVPLLEILSETLGVGINTKTVANQYDYLLENIGSEFFILLKASIGQIKKFSNEKIAEAVLKVRQGKILVDPGYDGVFGKVKIWEVDQEKTIFKKQMSLL